MHTESEALRLIDRALAASQGDEADAVFHSVDQNISRFANSQLHQNMSEESASLTLRVIADGAVGVATTTVLDDDEIAKTAAIALEAARHSGRVEGFSGLYCGNDPLPELATFDEATAAISPASKAQSLRAVFDAAPALSFAGVYSTGASALACGNSHGVRRFARMTHADATVIAIGDAGSGYATARVRSASRLQIGDLGLEAARRATLSSSRTEDLEPGEYDVILEPPALAEVFDWLNMIALTGQSFEDGSSFFVGNIGKRVVGENFTLEDDALDPDFLPFPFDMEGMPKHRFALIENGVVRTPAVDKAWADRLQLTPTASAWQLGSPEHGAAFHLSMAGGDLSREEIIRTTKRGIWVTRFNYVNGLLEPKSALMTGTTRDGTFLIRDGEIAARLPNLRWTQSMVEAFRNIDALSRERRSVGTWYNHFGGTLAPVTRIRGWNVTGKQGSSG